MTAQLLVTAGAGPVEVRRFVGQLGPALEGLLRDRGVPVLDVAWVGEPDAPRSMVLRLADDRGIADLLGTHLLVSADRGPRSRRRWFARVSLHRAPSRDAPPLDPRDVTLSACRAGGPGGQHMNTTSTAVRAVHRPSGVAVRAAGERSQAANRKAALARLQALLADELAKDATRAQRERWAAHHRVERGRPVLTWSRGARGELALAP